MLDRSIEQNVDPVFTLLPKYARPYFLSLSPFSNQRHAVGIADSLGLVDVGAAAAAESTRRRRQVDACMDNNSRLAG